MERDHRTAQGPWACAADAGEGLRHAVGKIGERLRGPPCSYWNCIAPMDMSKVSRLTQRLQAPESLVFVQPNAFWTPSELRYDLMRIRQGDPAWGCPDSATATSRPEQDDLFALRKCQACLHHCVRIKPTQAKGCAVASKEPSAPRCPDAALSERFRFVCGSARPQRSNCTSFLNYTYSQKEHDRPFMYVSCCTIGVGRCGCFNMLCTCMHT